MTGLEEAIVRLDKAFDKACIAYKQLPWWNIKARFLERGSIETLDLVIELLHQLRHKYDNQTGRFN